MKCSRMQFAPMGGEWASWKAPQNRQPRHRNHLVIGDERASMEIPSEPPANHKTHHVASGGGGGPRTRWRQGFY